MQRTAIGVFSTESEAERAVRALRDSQTSVRQDNVGDGVTSGAAWGGLAGLALGAGAIAIPGLGPIVAAGPIAAALRVPRLADWRGGYSTGAFRRRGAANYRRKSVKARSLPCLGAVTAKWTVLRRYCAKTVPAT